MATLVGELDPSGYHAPAISAAELAHFREYGYVFLGRCAPLETIEALGQRIDELMVSSFTSNLSFAWYSEELLLCLLQLGAGADYPRMMMSVCPSETGSWEHPATQQTEGFKYPTLGYRKIQGLEEDAIFRSWVQHPLWRDVTRRVIGEDSKTTSTNPPLFVIYGIFWTDRLIPVGINRAMYFAKPAATEVRSSLP